MISAEHRAALKLTRKVASDFSKSPSHYAKEVRLAEALVDLMAFYDRGGSGSWTNAEVQRLREIRELAASEKWWQQS